MNRDGDQPGQPPDAAGTEAGSTGAHAEKADNVIQFPGARLRAAPPLEPPPDATSGSQTDEPAAAGAAPEGEADAGMTLDAFERAVRSAVRDKLGEGQPQGADELVAQVFSALTGKDAKTALAEVRQRLSEPIGSETPGDFAGDVIDLSAVRDARQRANLDAAKQIGGALKDSFNQFLSGLARRPGVGAEITLDAAFFKQHGPSLLGNLFQGLAAALMQQARPPGAPPPAAAPEPTRHADQAPTEAPPPDEAAPSASAASDQPTPSTQAGPSPQVQVKVDLGSILAGLFRRRTPPPEGTPPERR